MPKPTKGPRLGGGPLRGLWLVRHHLVLKMRDDVAGELTSLAPKLAPTIEENQAMAAKRQQLILAGASTIASEQLSHKDQSPHQNHQGFP